MKTKPTTVVILILLAMPIVGLGIYRMCLTNDRKMTHCYAPNYRVGFRCARSAD